MSSDHERVMDEINRKILREKAIMEAASNMLSATENQEVRKGVLQKIQLGHKKIEGLQEELNTLQLQMQLSERSGPPTPQHGGREHYRLEPEGYRSPIPTPSPKDQNSRLYAGKDAGVTGEMSQRAPIAYQALQSVPKARPNFSKLGKAHRRKVYQHSLVADVVQI